MATKKQVSVDSQGLTECSTQHVENCFSKVMSFAKHGGMARWNAPVFSPACEKGPDCITSGAYNLRPVPLYDISAVDRMLTPSISDYYPF